MEEEAKVYSLSYVKITPDGNRVLSFSIFVNKIDLKREILSACDDLVPGEDVIRVGLTSMTKPQFKEITDIINQVNQETQLEKGDEL